MGFLSDLFGAKGTVDVVLTIKGVPPEIKERHKLGFVPVARKGAPPPRSPGDDCRWTGFSDYFSVSQRLPPGFWQVTLVIEPIIPDEAGKMKKDASRAIPFWPLAEAFEITPDGKASIRLEVAFPRAALS